MAFSDYIKKPDIGYAAKWLDYHVLLRLCGALPAPLAYWAARQRARYRYHVRHDAREAAKRHMQLFLPNLSESELQQKALEFFYSPCFDELETYFFPSLTPHNLGNIMQVEGRENLDRCLDQGRGAILFSSHSAGVGLYFVTLGVLGYKANIVARSLEEEDNPLHPVVRSYGHRRVPWIEKQLGRPFMAPARGNAAILCERLKANELVVAVIDVPPEIVRYKVEVQFMGRTCLFPSGFAWLAQEATCGMIPTQGFYLPGWNRQKLVFHEPIYSSGNVQADVQVCVSILEKMILEHPSQWYIWDNLPMLWASSTQADGNNSQSVS